jgi:outer membrane scaffolding protein for murein synthesis (MipA/OmpV family)
MRISSKNSALSFAVVLMGMTFCADEALAQAHVARNDNKAVHRARHTALHKRIAVRHRPPVRLVSPMSYAAPGATLRPAAKSGWLVTVNGKVNFFPAYTGAARYIGIAFPTLSFRRPDEPALWTSPDESLSFRLYETPIFAVGLLVGYRGGRYDNEAHEVKGVHNVLWTIEPGIFAEAWLLPNTIRLRGEFRHGIRAEDGFTATIGADWLNRFDCWTFAIGPRLNFGDAKFMRENFGITAADALAAPAFSPYRPDGGLYSAGVLGSVTFKQSEAWSYTLHAGYDHLTGNAARSPILGVSGSRNQWKAGATVSYTFGIGDLW